MLAARRVVRAQHRLLVVRRRSIRGKTKDEKLDEPRSIPDCHARSRAMTVISCPASGSARVAARGMTVAVLGFGDALCGEAAEPTRGKAFQSVMMQENVLNGAPRTRRRRTYTDTGSL